MKTNIFRPKNLFMIFLGNTTMALGIVMFVLPNELMTGGTTGLSLIIDHYLHLPFLSLCLSSIASCFYSVC